MNHLKSSLVNPHLDGGAFFWEAGPRGVLLIHGFTATTAEVRPLAQILHQQGYTVAGPLLPGHGVTPEDCNRYGWRDWVNAAETVYQRLARVCRQVVIGGESLGGMLGLYLAAQHPEAAAVLAYAPALRLRRQWFLWAAPVLSLFFASYSKSAHPPYAADAFWQGYPVFPLRAAAQFAALQRRTWPRLSAVRQPLLIAQGRLDATVDERTPEWVAGRVSSTVKEIHWFERSTHCVAIDAEQQEVAQVTLQFLERVG